MFLHTFSLCHLYRLPMISSSKVFSNYQAALKHNAFNIALSLACTVVGSGAAHCAAYRVERGLLVRIPVSRRTVVLAASNLAILNSEDSRRMKYLFLVKKSVSVAHPTHSGTVVSRPYLIAREEIYSDRCITSRCFYAS